jgi:protoporphyrinogen oxidase
VLWASLGPTICESFYFPYARKIWGRPPEELSAIQARRRVSANSFARLARKILGQLPGFRQPGGGRFYYPRHGFGQISEALARGASDLGAELRYGSRVIRLQPPSGPGGDWGIEAERAGTREQLEAPHLWSTIPLPLLARLSGAAAAPGLEEAIERLEYRAMVLIYLVLPVSRFTEFDAHYFPGADLSITRLSEPKNYAAASEPPDRTVLCAELPCSPDDAIWRLDAPALGALVADDLARAGIPLAVAPVRVEVRRLRQAYPIYATGYERWFGVLDAWAEGLPGLLSFGRQGLFAHDNTHHALAMAYAAADCLEGPAFREDRWAAHRRVFETHVVED